MQNTAHGAAQELLRSPWTSWKFLGPRPQLNNAQRDKSMAAAPVLKRRTRASEGLFEIAK
jgi:hypothetical protein